MRISVALTGFIVLWILASFAAVGQTANSDAASFLGTNRFSDGSSLEIQAVSFGVIHRIPALYNPQPEFFKSARPTIMFTTLRKAGAGKYLENIWTTAEALDASGHWYPLWSRFEPRPVQDGFERGSASYNGSPLSKYPETWEFPDTPEPDTSLRVRILLESITNVSSVEFQLSNDSAWRERSMHEQTNGFDPQEWLDNELIRATRTADIEYIADLISQGANVDSRKAEGILVRAISSRDVRKKAADVHLAIVEASMGLPGDWTPLDGVASERQTLAIIRLLGDRGANVNVRAAQGCTALIWAAQRGDLETVKYLLSKGADPSLKTEYGKTAIEMAEGSTGTNRIEIVKLLKEAQTGK